MHWCPGGLWWSHWSGQRTSGSWCQCATVSAVITNSAACEGAYWKALSCVCILLLKCHINHLYLYNSVVSVVFFGNGNNTQNTVYDTVIMVRGGLATLRALGFTLCTGPSSFHLPRIRFPPLSLPFPSFPSPPLLHPSYCVYFVYSHVSKLSENLLINKLINNDCFNCWYLRM